MAGRGTAILPEELMVEIVSRLPPDCVARFKCVSKYWYYLIDDPKFLDSLQHRYILVKRAVNKNHSDLSENENILSSLRFPLESEVLDAESDISLGQRYLHMNICGNYHGLVCVSYRLDDIFLCNTTSRELRKLPPSIILPSGRGRNIFSNAVGFGYDPKSRDFKVVRILLVRDVEDYRVEVYDLGKDSWREIESRVCGRVIYWPSFGMYYQGKYYWLALRETSEEIVLWFDMSKEVFGAIPVPESFEHPFDGGDPKYRGMGVWKGRIVMFYYDMSFVYEKNFEIWAMEKDNYSWSKVFTIGPVSRIRTPLAFVNSHELVMEADDGQLILYNLNTQRIVQLPVKGIPASFQAALV